MILPTCGLKIFFCCQPVDMRLGYQGLAAMVCHKMNRDPLSGHLFAFFNKRKNKVKLLFWDRDGYGLFYKSLVKGVFKCDFTSTDSNRLLQPYELSLILEGVQMIKAKTSKRFQLK